MLKKLGIVILWNLVFSTQTFANPPNQIKGETKAQPVEKKASNSTEDVKADKKTEPNPTTNKKEVKVSKKLSPLEKRKLIASFVRAQQTEILAIQHQHQLEAKEMESMLSKEKKRWMANLGPKKDDYFRRNRDVTLRRRYLFEEKRSIRKFQMDQQKEKLSRLSDQKKRLQVVRSKQKEKYNSFTRAIKEDKTPDASLWPSGI